MKYLLPVTAFALLFTAAPASADWQYTRWGMTPDQVVAASSGKVHAGQVQDVLVGTYEAGGRSYEAAFHFRNTHLYGVELTLHGQAQCEGMATDLATVYGAPNRKNIGRYGNGVAEWFDYVDHNDVVLTFLVKNCSISYGPLTTAASSGL